MVLRARSRIVQTIASSAQAGTSLFGGDYSTQWSTYPKVRFRVLSELNVLTEERVESASARCVRYVVVDEERSFEIPKDLMMTCGELAINRLELEDHDVNTLMISHSRINYFISRSQD